MIHDIDESLRALLEARIVRGANIEIAFEAPNEEWAAKRQGPAINCFLYDIREDLERRRVQFEPQRDGEGIVTGRQTPPRRFKLEYLLTVWAQRPEDEHRLLAAVLETFVVSDEFPTEHLQGRAADVGPIRTTIGLPLPPERSLSDVWSSLGGGLRPALDLVVTVPLGVRTDPHVGPPVLEGPRVSVLGPDGNPLPPMRSPAQRRAATAGHAAADDLAAATGEADTASKPQPPDDGGPADAPRDGAPRRPGSVREVVDAGRFGRGRQVVELAEEDVRPGRRIGISTIPRPEA